MRELNKFELTRGFSEVVDLVNTTLANHHLRVAFIAEELAGFIGLSRDESDLTVVAAMLHDVGVIPLGSQIDSLVFETDLNRHAKAGYTMLAVCPLIRKEAEIVRDHHSPWAELRARPLETAGPAVPANIVNLADTVDIQAQKGIDAAGIIRLILSRNGSDFSPLLVAAMGEILLRPGFLKNLSEAARNFRLPPRPNLLLNENDSSIFAMMFANVIDARSPFTATHSTAVAHLTLYLHQLAEFPQSDRQTIFIAGLLHDIGKVGVPLELIEKPGRLTDDEFKAVSRHAYLSEKILSGVTGFDQVAPWGAWHHERLDGTGYPNRLTGADIPMEARLTAVADILTALTESRPYRPGLPAEKGLAVLRDMVKAGALDSDVVALAWDHIEEINETRSMVQKLADHYFRKLSRAINE